MAAAEVAAAAAVQDLNLLHLHCHPLRLPLLLGKNHVVHRRRSRLHQGLSRRGRLSGPLRRKCDALQTETRATPNRERERERRTKTRDAANAKRRQARPKTRDVDNAKQRQARAKTRDVDNSARRKRRVANRDADNAMRRKRRATDKETAAAAQGDKATTALLHSIHTESGFDISANSEELRRLIAQGVPSSDASYRSLVENVQKDITKHCVVTPVDVQRMVAAYGERMDPARPLMACAACGVRDPARPPLEPLTLDELESDHWLRYTADEKTELLAMPTVTLMSVSGEQREVHLKLLRSFFDSGNDNLFHVHPEPVEVDPESGEHKVNLCECCSKAAATPTGRPPTYTIAAGCNYGLPTRLGIDPPSAFEALVLADVRTYSLTAKVHVPGQWCAARTLLRGHMIAFVHDGPSVVSAHFDEARVASALAHLQLVFVGSAGRQTRLEQRALAIPDLRLRTSSLFNYLAIRHALHTPEGVSPPDVDAISALVRSAVDATVTNARHVPDDTAEVYAQPSDVANVRDVAWSDEHAQREIVPEQGQDVDDNDPAESNVLLDPVGVFMQGVDSTVGKIFADLAKLIDKTTQDDCNTQNDKEQGDEGGEGEAPGEVGEQPDASPPEQDEPVAQEPRNERRKAGDGGVEGESPGEVGGQPDASPAEQEEPAAEEPRNKRRKVRRSAAPLNEFTENSTLLYGAFWHLFPLRTGIRGDGPLTPATRRHIFTQFHNEFAHSPQLLFLLADQVQRHAAARGVALRVQSDSASFNAFAAMVADSDTFIERLEVAKVDPLSKDSRELLKSVSRFVVSSGKVVPWSAEERAGEITRLYALWRRFGPPSCFLSLAPDDVHQAQCIRLSYRCGASSSFPANDGGLLRVLRGEATLEEIRALNDAIATAAPMEIYKFTLDEACLQWLATRNPIATTLFYEQLTEAVFTELIGVPPSNRRRKAMPLRQRHRGFIGTGVAWSYVHETNGRKSLHFHASIHGGAAPALLSNVVGVDGLEAAVCAALNSVYTAAVPLDVHALDAARRTLKVNGVKYTYLDAPALHGDDSSFDAFLRGAAFRGVSYGFHTHAQTCHKGKSGKWGCRMSRPAGHPVPTTRVLAVTPSNADRNNESTDLVAGAIQWACQVCGDAPGQPPLDVDVRSTRSGDGSDPQVSLTYELQRPLLQSSSNGSATLRELLGMDVAAVEALSNDECLRYAQRVVEELLHLLPLPEVGEALKHRLEHVTALEARDLVDTWSRM